jgi:hypothetical protein
LKLFIYKQCISKSADNSTQDSRSHRGRHILVLKRTYSTASLCAVKIVTKRPPRTAGVLLRFS